MSPRNLGLSLEVWDFLKFCTDFVYVNKNAFSPPGREALISLPFSKKWLILKGYELCLLLELIGGVKI